MDLDLNDCPSNYKQEIKQTHSLQDDIYYHGKSYQVTTLLKNKKKRIFDESPFFINDISKKTNKPSFNEQYGEDNRINSLFDIEDYVDLINQLVKNNEYDHLSCITHDSSRIGVCPKCSFPVILYKELKCYNPKDPCFVIKELEYFKEGFTLDNFLDLYLRHLKSVEHFCCSG